MGASAGGAGWGFEAFGRSWSADRAMTITHALDQVLDSMEARLNEVDDLPVDPDLVSALPLSTGLEPLDRVLRGGLRAGTVTLVDADIPAQATALLTTVSLLAPHPRLVDAGDLGDLVVDLMASSSGVPGIAVHGANLSSTEWRNLAEGVGRLADQEMHVSSTGAIGTLAETASSLEVAVVVVYGPERLGPIPEALLRLARLASDLDVAVLTAAGPVLHLPQWVLSDIVTIEMAAYDMGGRATLLRSDPEEMLIVAGVDVECLAGIVR